jgi:hypothetical protein
MPVLNYVMTALRQHRKEKVIRMNIFTMRSDLLLTSLHDRLGGEVCDDYLYLDTGSPLLFQAHVDTVRLKDDIKIIRKHNIMRANDAILGADDRAGVFAILKIAEWCKTEKLQCPNILLTDGEEGGGWGMITFTESHKNKELSHVRLAVAFDRQGGNEYVTYNDLHDNVRKYIESFGFNKAIGSFSDIEFFTDEYQIPSVNLSVGYYMQHTKQERLHWDELLLTIERAKMIVKTPINKLYKSKKSPWAGYRSQWAGNARSWGYSDWTTKTAKNHKSSIECEWCGALSAKYVVHETGMDCETLVCERCAGYFHGDASYELQTIN